MKVILSGAGASFGSPNVIPTNPPLSRDLYSRLQARFPWSWGKFPANYKKKFSDNFEIAMGELWNSGSHSVPNLMQEMGIFFAEFSISTTGADTYSQLIGKLRKAKKLKGVAFSTLNYETLLEIAISLSGNSVNYLGEFFESDETITVWKLHGSCNFLPGEGVSATRGVNYGRGVTFNTDVKIVNPGEVAAYLGGNTALYPIMSIFAEEKTVQISPDLVKRIQDFWKESIQKAESIAVIGVNPNPIDKHIWEPLAATPATIFFIGDEKNTKKWIGKYRTGKSDRFIGSLFQDCVDDLVDIL
jgi:hypothetical protein